MIDEEIDGCFNPIHPTKDGKAFTQSRKAITLVLRGALRHHEPVSLPYCGGCNLDDVYLGCVCQSKEYKDC